MSKAFSDFEMQQIKQIVKEVLERKLRSAFDGSTFNQKLAKIENNLKNVIKISSENLESLRRINRQLDNQTERLNAIRSHVGLSTISALVETKKFSDKI